MPKYIEANWLLERAVPHGWSTPKWVSDIVIEDAPAADVCENIHAKWNYKQDGFLFPFCPICGEYAIDNFESNFCPYCGAQMDKKE